MSKQEKNSLIGKLIAENEAKTCRSTARIMFAVAIAYTLVAILIFAGLFSGAEAFPYVLLGMAVVFVFVGFWSKGTVKGNRYMKYVQILLLLFTFFVINMMTGYKAWLLSAVPIVLSSRFNDRKFTIRVGIIAGIFAFLSAYANAYWAAYIGFIDVDMVSYGEPGTLPYYGWLNNAVLQYGYDVSRVFGNTLRLSFLPNCISIVLIVMVCNSYIKEAEEMLLAAYAAAGKEQEQIRLKFQSAHDDLTGLQNRLTFRESMERVKNTKGYSGFIYCDLNGLKITNDTLGHQAGDQLLIRYSEVLSKIFRSSEIYRISGDEFICLLENISEVVFVRRMSALRERLGQDEIPMAAVGAAYGANGDIADLMKKAEALMYADKEKIHAEHPELTR